MFENLTYKTKNQILGITAILLLFVVYTLGINKTMEAYHDYSQAKDKMELAKNAPFMAEQLERELMQLDSRLGNQSTQGQNTSEALLSLITNYCQINRVVLKEFPQTSTAHQGDMSIETNQFVVSGSFHTLLKLVYMLEQKNKVGKVSSVKYQLKKDFKTKEMVLTATVFIQNIKKQAHEK